MSRPETPDRSTTDTQQARLAAQIIAAYVTNNDTMAEALPTLIRSVYTALEEALVREVPEAVRPEPVVPIKNSVFPDYIVCLEDGRKLKMLRRHLRAAFGMTPEDYRQRWGLPQDYSMIAPNYRNKRAEVAQSIGLGRTIKRDHPTLGSAPSDGQEDVGVQKFPTRQRGRPGKSD